MSQFDHFVGTRPVTGTHAFDVSALESWLLANMAGFEGPLSVEMFKGGQSNPTYKLITPKCAYVMRAKPGPVAKLLPSAHAIEREFAVMKGLSGTAVPVAQMHVLCEDEAIMGRAFYVMEFVAGRVLWDQSLPSMSNAQRGEIYDEMNRVIAALHSVKFAEQGLANYGKPGSYIERQIGRWSKQYAASQTQVIPEMDRLMAWLPANIPSSAKDESLVSIVHGDYRLDNLMFHPTEPKVLAVLDWELSTLGHPLADFSYHCMAWHIKPGSFRGIGGLDHHALGIPNEAEYIKRYCERTGFTTPEKLALDWNFYMAYNLFRIAAILQGIAKRVVDGTASSEQAKSSGAGAKPMAEMAWHFASQVH
ncbi:MAG: phosphotransferase family protein [Burkholderiales bacterium]|nr:phosphotransferase family protein [Burkholderiales bacterium]